MRMRTLLPRGGDEGTSSDDDPGTESTAVFMDKLASKPGRGETPYVSRSRDRPR